MARILYRNDDIDIFLTEEDIIELGTLQILNKPNTKGRRIAYSPLELDIPLPDGTIRKAIIQEEDFDDYGDGIKMEIVDSNFYIRLNDTAYWRIRNSLEEGRQLLTGTRYDSMNKINFWKED